MSGFTDVGSFKDELALFVLLIVFVGFNLQSDGHTPRLKKVSLHCATKAAALKFKVKFCDKAAKLTSYHRRIHVEPTVT